MLENRISEFKIIALCLVYKRNIGESRGGGINFRKNYLTIHSTSSIIKHNKPTKGVLAMYQNHSNYYLYIVSVNPVHVWSQGFIADGKNGYCENLNYDKE